MSKTIRVGSGMKNQSGNIATKFRGAMRGRSGGCASCRGKK